MTTDPEAFARDVERLFDHFASHGCPCRFPRFRATVVRDTREIGAPFFATWEHQALVATFDQRVTVVERCARPSGHEGRCATCGSRIERWGEQTFRDAWIEYLKISPSPEATDVGAGVRALIPHCHPFFRASPSEPGLEHLLALHYPRMSISDWLAWMRELQ